MSTNDTNTADDADMMECDDEKVVTMMDVLQEQQEFEEDANAVLGGSDDKNCTYSKGYIKRQAIYACMTCTDSREDSSKRAGVCLACSLNCHENHELIELYTKRNFRCDCGNEKFNSHPCQFTPNKTDLNLENKYNQNFSGLYCVCHRPYPDPESTSEDDMIQCIICEDWLHSSHLDAIPPANDQYSEMICKACMEKNNFLHDYSAIAVFSDNITITNDLDESDNNISIVELADINKVQNVCIESKNHDSIHFNNHDLNHSNQSETSQNKLNSPAENQDETSKDSTNTQIEDKIVNECPDTTLNPEAVSEKSNDAIIDLNDLSANVTTDAEMSENTTTNKEDNYIEDNLNSNKENQINTENNTEDHDNYEIADNNKQFTDTLPNKNNTELETLVENNVSEKLSSNDSKKVKDYDYENSEKEENELLRDENMEQNKFSPQKVVDDIMNEEENIEKEENELLRDENMEENKLSPQRVVDEIMNEEENIEKEHSPVKKDDNVATVNECVANDSISKVTEEISDLNEKLHQEGIIDNTKSNTDDDVVETEKDLEDSTDTEIANTVSDDTTVGSEIKVKNSSVNDDNLNEKLNVSENTIDICKNVESNPSDVANNKLNESNKENANEHNENKRKHIDKDESLIIKKPKLSDDNCIRPQGVKKIFKGATFWPHNFRQKLCTCNECLSMYKDLSVLFLIDLEDTVSAYERLGKEKTNGATPSQYEKGLEALSSLDRVQQINALTEYNKMKDKLLDFLKSFKDRDEVVKEEDIKAFFAGMKPKREPDGVYFCR